MVQPLMSVSTEVSLPIILGQNVDFGQTTRTWIITTSLNIVCAEVFQLIFLVNIHSHKYTNLSTLYKFYFISVFRNIFWEFLGYTEVDVGYVIFFNLASTELSLSEGT